MPIVAMPDGAHVQFPDEMPPDQIRALIQSRFPHVGSSGPRHGYVGTFDDPAPPKGSIFDFTDPAGKQYTVNGPAGSTPEQAFAILQQHLGQQPSGGKLGTTFDAEGARKAGYSEAEIRGVKGALAAGYTPQEISDHLSKPRGMFDDIPPVGDKQSSALPDGFIPDQPAAGSGGFLANAADFVKSMPEGAATALRNYGRGHQIEAEFFNQPFTGGAIDAGPDIPTGLPTPQGKAGEYGAALGEALGNPLSYLGSAGLPIKVAGAVLSAMGGKAGEDTGIPGGRLAGAVLGSATAAKTLGLKAAVPTEAELAAAKDAGYTAARNSGVELDPQKFASDFAAQAERHLTQSEKYAFTGGKDGTAPRTLGLLEKLKNPPEDAVVTASGLDTLRRQINDIAGETRDFKPTADAKAAMVLKRLYADYLENVPETHVLAGSAPDYAMAVGEANANNAALQRLKTFDARVTKAQNAADRQISGSLESQIKSKAGGMLDNPKALRGLTQNEIDQLQLINSGNLPSNLLRQAGKGGAAHVIPVALNAAHIFASPATGIPLFAGMVGSRLASEAITKSRAGKLAEMLAKRSPLYEQRVNALPPARPSAVRGAVLRAVAGGM
jgi:hypothetical protein